MTDWECPACHRMVPCLALCHCIPLPYPFEVHKKGTP